ncbi:MAG: hypothetical protein JSV16_10910 [Candidatus Hydrogenedentota bacterium]|nr:MAG: hypothetical protein JSV16_10910 [Candidatus Hydrogenedentota bacterium]
MNSIDGILSDMVGWMSDFFVHTLLPWAWENKFWIAVALPFIVLIAVARWIRG